MDSSGDDPTAAALAWLLACDEPAVRCLTRRDLLGDRDGAAAAADAAQVLEGPKARALLAGQQPDGGFGVHPYRKWTGAHWRLVSLVELAAPAGEPRLQAAASTVLDWLTGRSHRERVQVIDGLARRCASQEGNALAVACRLGMTGDPRAELLARSLVDWQWPDGGWNCDVDPAADTSSFMETLLPMRGLWLHGTPRAREAARAAAEVFLTRRLAYRASDGTLIRAEFAKLHFPLYWHYDILGGLKAMMELGLLGDPRCADALDLLESMRLPGGWPAHARYYRASAEIELHHDWVDWGGTSTRRPNPWVTAEALAVLRAAGRLG